MGVFAAILVVGCPLPTKATFAYAMDEQVDGDPVVDAPEAPEVPPLSPQDESNIRLFRTALESPSSDLTLRKEAAVRLIEIGHPAAIDPLIEHLSGENDELKSAIAHALNTAERPPIELLKPATKALRTASRSTRDLLALALPRFGPAAHRILHEVVHDQAREPEERLGAIAAMGTLRTRDAAASLIELLDARRDEPEAIINAACAALQVATGMRFGNDIQRWRQWWKEAGDLSPEEWLSKLVMRLTEALAAAELNIEQERSRTARAHQRLGQAFRELFPRLELEEQLRSLPVLLDDSWPILREFAVDRIARLLRDSVRIPVEVQDKLAERIGDEASAIRLQAARLLDQMNYEAVAAGLSERLVVETNDDVVEAFLDILARRPAAVAFPAVAPRLDSARHGERAALVLWEIVNQATIEPEQLALVSDPSRREERLRRSPVHARLLARVTPANELEPIIALLDGEDAAMKQAVAEGLARRGEVQPLLDRIGDEQIYPHAIRAIARSDSPWPAFRQMLTLPPPSVHETVWRDQLHALAARLPAEQGLEADDLLASVNGMPLDLRIRLLQRRLGQNDNGNGMPLELRSALTLRLAELLMRTEQPQLALERLESSVEVAALPAATPLRFRALVRTGQYDRAQQLVPDPQTWVNLLAQWVEQRPDQAALLHQQIGSRFGDQLNGELREQLNSVAERLPAREPSMPDAAEGAEETGEAESA
jgi:HEAT repeat protein